jgi:hypothetical protein
VLAELAPLRSDEVTGLASSCAAEVPQVAGISPVTVALARSTWLVAAARRLKQQQGGAHPPPACIAQDEAQALWSLAGGLPLALAPVPSWRRQQGRQQQWAGQQERGSQDGARQHQAKRVAGPANPQPKAEQVGMGASSSSGAGVRMPLEAGWGEAAGHAQQHCSGAEQASSRKRSRDEPEG